MLKHSQNNKNHRQYSCRIGTDRSYVEPLNTVKKSIGVFDRINLGFW